jgi:hypothetical protein
MKQFFAALLLAGTMLIAPPAGAVVLQQTYTGVVTFGFDVTGLFGTAGASLIDKSFTAIFKIDTSLGSTTTGVTSDGGGNFIQLAGGGSAADPFLGIPTPIISATLSIGGSAAVMISGGYEDRTAIRSYPISGARPSSYLSAVLGEKGDILSVFLSSIIASFPADFTATGTYLAQGGGAGDQFKIVDPLTFNTKAFGNLEANQLVVSTLSVQSDVPVPAALPLFAGGLGVIGLTLVRRRWRALSTT